MFLARCNIIVMRQAQKVLAAAQNMHKEPLLEESNFEGLRKVISKIKINCQRV